MANRDTDKNTILLMEEGDTAYINWHEEGGGEVQLIAGRYHLSEVPQYGGVPNLEGIYELDKIDDLLDKAYSWT